MNYTGYVTEVITETIELISQKKGTEDKAREYTLVSVRYSVISTKRSAWRDLRDPSTLLGMTRRGSG